MSVFHSYTVQYDHNRHSTICVAVERKYTYHVPMHATEVAVKKMTNEEFAHTFEVIPEYPVRRAAEIYLAAPDKEVSSEAREHLERILSDPAYVYDRSLFSEPHVIKENLMASAAAKAASKVAVKKVKREAAPGVDDAAAAANAAAGPIVGKVGKRAVEATEKPKGAAKKAAANGTAKGRTPALPGDTRIKVANTDSVKRGYMFDFVEEAKKLEKGSRGKGVPIDALVDAGVSIPSAVEAGRDAAWVRTYVSYGMAPNRGIFVLA